jgi:hypothetical protein
MKKGAVSVKTIIVMVILLLVVVLGVLMMNNVKTLFSGASAGSEPKGVLATPGSDGKTATVSWTTDKAVQAVVLYGASPAALLLSAPETNSTSDHSVILSSLRAGQNYYFRIEVGEEVFDDSGIPWSFKTPAGNKPTMAPLPTLAIAPTVAGTCSRTIDYNRDGAVNTIDFITCMKGMVSPKAATSAAATTSTCDNVDFDKNGVINSIDRIKCLQSKR